MAQQVFPQWSPVVKAHNEDQQEVYIPAAIIHAQTRDGKDELIVGAANMQFDPETGDYLPTHAGNPVEVRARALETLLQTLGKEETLAQSVDKLNSILSRLEAKLDTAIFDSQGNPISAANRLPVDAAVSGTVDVSDRADRQLGKVTLTGSIPAGSALIGYVRVDESLRVLSNGPTMPRLPWWQGRAARTEMGATLTDTAKWI